MNRKLAFFLLVLIAIRAGAHTASANIGWTRAQMDAKYGKPASVGGAIPSNVVWHLDGEMKSNFPHLLSEGFNAIRADFYEGRVCFIILYRDNYRALLPTWKGSREKYDAQYKKFQEAIKQRASMPFEEAKIFALSYIDANPDPRQIRNERYHSGPNPDFPGANEDPIGSFDYKGWRVIWGPDSIIINPADGTALARAIKARDTKTLNEAEAREQSDSAATARREAR